MEVNDSHAPSNASSLPIEAEQQKSADSPPPAAPSDSESTNHLPIKGDDFRFGNLLFTSRFDSGNLQRVEKVLKDGASSEKAVFVDPMADVEFNVWTRPDCANTPFENGCRSWFYFGIRGYTPGKLMKINIMNMNKQGKLYSQGHSPIYRILPHRPQWQRLKERCTFECSLTEFVLTFYYRFPECRGTVYFSFCYPWSYTESLQQMAQLDERFEGADDNITDRDDEDIYYHRELLTHSLDGLRIDLLTISSYQGITEKREPVFDQRLFPQRDELRCRNFVGKRVFVLTSRVHPGESPASFVYNGFIHFLLRRDDKRAIQLRRQYVFKFIPLLNPDGVVRGHYRTDSRGVNLNRLYLDPTPDLYPSIYAAKSLLVFHHINNCPMRLDYLPDMSVIFRDLPSNRRKSKTPESEGSSSGSSVGPAGSTPVHSGGRGSGRSTNSILNRSSTAGSGSVDIIYAGSGGEDTAHLNHPRLRFIPAEESGIAFYVDLHGHASKRGCFMYGNHLTDEQRVVDNLLFPKLISMNSAHFDYGGCNFTEKNMYTKDRKDGHSKEGSGRVAIHKSIGITHSYTLECNYNSGRLVNAIASTSDGRITPPPPAGFPPKFTEAHFEEVGRALAIAAIDYTSTNPWSRIQYSDLPTVQAVRDWIHRSLRGGKGVAKYHRPSLSINPKSLSRNIGQFLSTKSDPVIKPIAAANNAANGVERNGFSFGKTPRFGGGNSQPSVSSCPSRKLPADLAPVREAHRRSFSLPTPTVLKCANKPRTLSDMSQTKSYSLRLMHTLSKQANKPLQALSYKQEDEKINGHLKGGSTPNDSTSAADDSEGQLLAVTRAESVNGFSKRYNKSYNGEVKVIEKRPIESRGMTPISDQANVFGIVLDKTVKSEKKVANRGTKAKKGTNIRVNVIDNSAPRRAMLQGANITLASNREVIEKEKAKAKIKEAEVKQFERELKNRMTKLKHSEAYWVEL